MGMLRNLSKRISGPGITPARTAQLVIDASPAASLVKARTGGHVSLVKKADIVGEALAAAGLLGVRAQVVLVLDHSGSMRDDYQSGLVRVLVERTLGLALQVDADGVVPVIPFDTVCRPIVPVTIDDYRTAVDRIWQPSQMGTTGLAEAVRTVIRLSRETPEPVFCIIVTDGAPDSRAAATREIIESSRWPIFVKFLALRDVPYLRDLDDLPAGRRLVDNVDTATITPETPDEEFAQIVVREWGTWIDAAIDAGVLTR